MNAIQLLSLSPKRLELTDLSNRCTKNELKIGRFLTSKKKARNRFFPYRGIFLTRKKIPYRGFFMGKIRIRDRSRFAPYPYP